MTTTTTTNSINQYDFKNIWILLLNEMNDSTLGLILNCMIV